MAIVTINDEHLNNIADAIREKNAGNIIKTDSEAVLETRISKTTNATGFDTCNGNYSNYLDTKDVVAIPGAKRMHVKVGYQTEGINFDWLYIIPENGDAIGPLGGEEITIAEYDFPDTDTVTFEFSSNFSYNSYLGYYAEITGYGEGKIDLGTCEYKPREMADAIAAIPSRSTPGGEEIVLRTPDEIYEQDRPADWPVLPDPVDDNEIYYLCKTIWDGTSKYFVNPEGPATRDVEWGYIDANGEFVVTQSVQNQAGVYWGRRGSSKETETDVYHVVRTTKGDSTYDNPTQSYQTSHTTNVLEIKARGSNLRFGGGSRASYYLGFSNCKFITLYGPQDWDADSSKKFSGCSALKCLRFDSDENNIFLQPNSKITSLASLFASCHCLEYAYPINNFTSVTNIGYIYQYCYKLQKIELANDVATTATSVLANCHGLKEASIKLPKSTSMAMFSNQAHRARRITNLDLSGATSTSNTQYLCGYTCEEMLNVKINSSLSYSSYSPFYYQNYGTYQLRRIVMDPTQEGMPTALKIGLYAADKEGIIEFFESLPYITTESALTIYNYALYDMPVEDVLAIAIEKGYTVSITK